MRVPVTQPLRPSPAGRVGPARPLVERDRYGEVYGGPRDVTSLSLSPALGGSTHESWHRNRNNYTNLDPTLRALRSNSSF